MALPTTVPLPVYVRFPKGYTPKMTFPIFVVTRF